MKRCCSSAFLPFFMGAVLLAVTTTRGGENAIAPPGAFDSNLHTVLTAPAHSSQTNTQTLQMVATSSAAEPTLCPAVATQCPPAETLCPPTATRCPKAETRCPVSETTCPAIETRCPAFQ